MTTRSAIVAMALLFAAVIQLTALDQQRPSTAPLKIVVIEGEGAVNIVQQKTAVAPVIEVRDRNDQPVAGATVNFVVRAGRATFGGARTLSVTTNAAGRAAAAGFTPGGAGALQIGATATFQGQTAAAVTIAQTNVMTAAEAAAASSAGAGGAGSGSASTAAGGGGAGAGGGGVSATTIGIVGGAVAAGAVVAKDKLAGGEDGGIRFSGQLSAVMPETEVAIPVETNYSCLRSLNESGTIEINFDSVDAPVRGDLKFQIHAHVNPGNCNFGPYDTDFAEARGNVSGSRDALASTIHNPSTFTTTSDVIGTGTVTEDYGFTGHFDDENQISGTITFDRTVIFRGPRYSSDSHGSIAFPVTLRRQ
jgi:hypothetical protein